jgi:hypothetical protein
MRALVVALLIAGSVAVAATAAEPNKGKVTAFIPRVDWVGKSTGYGYYTASKAARSTGGTPRCDAPACDEFTLEVTVAAPLTVSATYEPSPFLDLDIILPDGSTQYVDGGDDKTTTIARIEDAKPGIYRVRVTTDENVAADGAYKAYAVIATTPPAYLEPTTLTAPPTTSGPQLTIATRSASLKRLKRRTLPVAVGTTAPVERVKVFLRKGRKVVARASLARLDSVDRVRLKLPKKIRPGKYVLAASAGKAAATAPFTLTR